MVGKAIDWIGGRTGAFIILLALLVTGNVAFQIMTHKSSALTAWKGGGFGMYTEPHVEARSVWVTFAVDGKAARLRLWPEVAGMATWRGEVNLAGDISLGKVTKMAERLRYFPQSRNAVELLALVKRIRWRRDLTGGVLPSQGKTFERADLTLEVFENSFDIQRETLERNLIFSLMGDAKP